MFSGRDFEAELAEARKTLQQARRAPSDGEIGEVSAEAAEGRINVTVDSAGQLSVLTIDPRAMREGSAYLAAEPCTAINVALEQRAETLAGNEPVPDMDAMDRSQRAQKLQRTLHSIDPNAFHEDAWWPLVFEQLSS